MTQTFTKTKPSLMEAGLPCASLSAECQRDNSASSRPPQNTLHIWWARRAPTVCRAAILGSILPHDLMIPSELLPSEVPEVSDSEIEDLPPRLLQHAAFLEHLVHDLPATQLTKQHKNFLLGLGVRGDAALALARIIEANRQTPPVTLGPVFGYRHPPAFAQSPSSELLSHLQQEMRRLLGLQSNEPLVLLDPMAGGGSIPLEGVRYGLKVYANDVNPVAALVLKATLEYPARFGLRLRNYFKTQARKVSDKVTGCLARFFPEESSEKWWSDIKDRATRRFMKGRVVSVDPGGDSTVRFYLWCRTAPCTKCHLNIPLSTNFSLILKGEKSERYAAFPSVPKDSSSHECLFRVVPETEWASCTWPSLSSFRFGLKVAG